MKNSQIFENYVEVHSNQKTSFGEELTVLENKETPIELINNNDYIDLTNNKTNPNEFDTKPGNVPQEAQRCDSRTSQRSLSPLSIGPVPCPLDPVSVETAEEDFQRLFSTIGGSCEDTALQSTQMISFRYRHT